MTPASSPSRCPLRPLPPCACLALTPLAPAPSPPLPPSHQGHLISTICMHAPSTLMPTEQSKYGPVTSFAISAGCFVGSFVSIGLSSAFQQH